MGQNNSNPLAFLVMYYGHRTDDPTFSDCDLISVTANENIPFDIKRVFWVYLKEDDEGRRGNHAHKKCRQVIFCVKGDIDVSLFRVNNFGHIIGSVDITLSEKCMGLLIEPYTFISYACKYKYIDSIALIFASEPYDPDDLIKFEREGIPLAQD